MTPASPPSGPDPRRLTEQTLAYYEQTASAFRARTWDHNVSQNVQALLTALGNDGPHRVLDLGCGPGRDLCTFRALGHDAVGVDGAGRFVDMARRASGCEVWQQDFSRLDLPATHFDGVFANAVLFHVPRLVLPDTLRALHAGLRPGGALFCSNPRGPGIEQVAHEGRYGHYMELEGWQTALEAAGFGLECHYYRPADQPRERQPWLAMVCRRP